MRPRRGLTLLEIIAALAIIALIAGISMSSGKGQRRYATSQSITRELLGYDQGTRFRAQRSESEIELVISSDSIRQEAEDRSVKSRSPFSVPDGFALKNIWSAGSKSVGDGPIKVQIGREGRSRSYGMQLTTPEKKNCWIVVAGATGQQLVIENEAQARDIISTLAQARLDTP